MTTEEVKKEGVTRAKRTKEITFKCKFCERSKKLEEIRVLTRFFPPIVLCRDCEEETR